MIQGQEFHSIIQNIFGDVRGLNTSNQLQVCCPRCAESEGLSGLDGKFNLEINTAKKMFRCWKCDEPRFSGSLGKLIRLYGTRADYELYKSYAGSYTEYTGDEDEIEYVRVTLPIEMIPFSQMEEGNLEHFEAYNYLVNVRKLSREIILKYRLGFCTYGKYAKRIIIPSFDKNGEVNYFVSRSYNSKEKKKYDNPKSDKNLIIFNEGYINWDSSICLVEGVFEMFSYPINSIPMLGKSLSTTLFLKLKELKPNIIVLLDPDAKKDALKLFYDLKNIYVGCEEKVKIVVLPNNDDLDELRRNHGLDAVINALYSARELTIDDYFFTKLQKNNGFENGRGYRINSGNTGYWKSGSTKTTI
jgi:hypothetical protein